MTVAQIVAVTLSACSIVISVLSIRISRQSRREFEKTMASHRAILDHTAQPQDLGTRIMAKTARQAEAMRRVGVYRYVAGRAVAQDVDSGGYADAKDE